MFAGTTSACGWPRGQCGLHIYALLTGEAQLSAHSLPLERHLNYTAKNRAMLEQVGLWSEVQLKGDGSAVHICLAILWLLLKLAETRSSPPREGQWVGGIGAVHQPAVLWNIRVGPVPPLDPIQLAYIRFNWPIRTTCPHSETVCLTAGFQNPTHPDITWEDCHCLQLSQPNFLGCMQQTI